MSGPSKKIYRCEGCDKQFKSQGIGPHQRATGHAGRQEVLKATRSHSTALVPTKANGIPKQRLFKEVEGFTLLQDNDGGVWLAERIR